MFSTDYIYDHIFNLSEDQYNEMRDLVREDAKRAFRIAQIEAEGNDPAKSGGGRPKEKASIYGTNADPMGGRDRLGVHGMHGGFDSDNENVAETNTTKAQTMYHQMKDSFEDKKKMIFEDNKETPSKLLDENQLKDLED